MVFCFVWPVWRPFLAFWMRCLFACVCLLRHVRIELPACFPNPESVCLRLQSSRITSRLMNFKGLRAERMGRCSQSLEIHRALQVASHTGNHRHK